MTDSEVPASEVPIRLRSVRIEDFDGARHAYRELKGLDRQLLRDNRELFPEGLSVQDFSPDSDSEGSLPCGQDECTATNVVPNEWAEGFVDVGVACKLDGTLPYAEQIEERTRCLGAAAQVFADYINNAITQST